MRAVLLAGGKGTRLRPYSTIVPKPLMPVGDLPILEILIRQLEHAGFRHLTVSLGHLAPVVQAVLSHCSKFEARIDYCIEDTPLGTSGPVSVIPDLDESFLVTNGDILTNLDFSQFFEFHREQSALLTIAAFRRKVFIDYGVLRREKHLLTRYDEKPVIDYEVSMGIYVLDPACIKYIPSGAYQDIPDLVRLLLSEGERVAVYPFDGIWYDLGRTDDFKEVQDRLPDLRKMIPFLNGREALDK